MRAFNALALGLIVFSVPSFPAFAQSRRHAATLLRCPLPGIEQRICAGAPDFCEVVLLVEPQRRAITFVSNTSRTILTVTLWTDDVIRAEWKTGDMKVADGMEEIDLYDVHILNRISGNLLRFNQPRARTGRILTSDERERLGRSLPTMLWLGLQDDFRRCTCSVSDSLLWTYTSERLYRLARGIRFGRSDRGAARPGGRIARRAAIQRRQARRRGQRFGEDPPTLRLWCSFRGEARGRLRPPTSKSVADCDDERAGGNHRP